MPTTLKMMQFNIEYGGHGVDFASVAKSILAAEADVVAVQEGCAMMRQIAEDLSWKFFDARTQVVSKYPLLTPQPVRRGSILVEVEPRCVFGVVNIHPPARGFGPTRAAQGASVEQLVRREERVRMPDLRMALAAADDLLAEQIPVVLLGDFNAPSHLDWTQAVVGQREHVRAAVPWPMSVALEREGFRDVYRSVFPDPVRHPGLTWPANRPFVEGYNPAAWNKAADRIDQMYSKGRIDASAIKIVGEEGSSSDIVVAPWPTDHRALVATLSVELAAAPPLVSVDQRCVAVGTDVEVRVIANSSDATVNVVSKQGITRDNSPVYSARVTDVATIDTAQFEPGEYEVSLTSGAQQLSRAQLWVKPAGTAPLLELDKAKYEVGESITAAWRFAPGNKSDILAIFDATADRGTAKPRLWEYIMGEVAGSFRFDQHLRPRRWPLEAGNYTAALLQDDSSITLAHVDFRIDSVHS